MKELVTPIKDEDILSLHVGDVVKLNGVGVTSRDMAHKYMVERLIENRKNLSEEDRRIYNALKETLTGGFIYHSGPIVRMQEGKWKFLSSGPTTSIRTEVYQHKVIKHFNVKVVIGKGGMGELTLRACQENRTIYLHGIGGAGVLNAESVVEVLDVFKLDEFGTPEAIWKIKVEGFTGIITMDAYGQSLHQTLFKETMKRFESILQCGGEER